MSDYRVSFFLVNKEEEVDKDTGKRSVVKSTEYIGSLVIDDSGVDDRNLTLAAKAYRSAPNNLLRADKLVIEKL